jgi:TPR repeat protein
MENSKSHVEPPRPVFEPVRAPSPMLDQRGRSQKDMGATTSAIRSRSAGPRTMKNAAPVTPHPFPPRDLAGPLSPNRPKTAASSSPAKDTPITQFSTPASINQPYLPSPSIANRSASPQTHHRATSSSATVSTTSTIRAPAGASSNTLANKDEAPRSSLSGIPSKDLTPDQHLDIGIAAHSAGETTKSTYHLRLAANAGLPTAMLLYALACRHGWGMRAQPEEGVRWLRKAVEKTTAGLETGLIDSRMSALMDPSAAGTSATSAAAKSKSASSKTVQAQYALAMYELGVSSLRGWGCPKDKKLALRCFEIAGSWGDADALAEAGYCYAQGVGCKKDLKKAAGFYRRAEARGLPAVGNSW